MQTASKEIGMDIRELFFAHSLKGVLFGFICWVLVWVIFEPPFFSWLALIVIGLFVIRGAIDATIELIRYREYSEWRKRNGI